MTGPPRIPIWIATWAAPAELREPLAGDLLEEYHRRRVAGEPAGWWLWRQALISCGPLASLRVRGLMRSRELVVLAGGVLAVAACFLLYNQEWFLGLVRRIDGSTQLVVVVVLNLLAPVAGGLVTGTFGTGRGCGETGALALLLGTWLVTIHSLSGTMAPHSLLWAALATVCVLLGGRMGVMVRAS